MFDIKLIRENPDLVKNNIKKKFQEDKLKLVDEVLENDIKWRSIKKDIDDLRHERNKISSQINEYKKENKDVAELLNQAKQIPTKISNLEKKQEELVELNKSLLKQIPNIMHETVPSGKDDSENPVIKECKNITKKNFEVKNHVEILEEKDLVDFEKSANISGNGFYILKGDLALLNQALIRFAIEFMQSKGYTYIEPPLMIKKEILEGAMDTKGFQETIYSLEGRDLHLIGTSEHVLLGLHANQAIPEQELPKKYFSYTMCFRQEIGSHGINEKGLWRTHQFNKVEQVVFCAPEDSYKIYDEIQANTEELFNLLGLPFRVIECCSGDLAIWKAKSADIEVYRPTTNDFGEVTSVTNATDFQARSLNSKIIRKDGTREYLHTLNNTAIATSRALVAIIENYQNEDGSITIPDVLVPFMFGKKKI
ncbi:MAG: serine--tRNA ligase [Candidatus Woesearchaeota archaeon]